MTLSDQELKALNALTTVGTDGRTSIGTTPDGRTVTSWYKGSGNYDISVDGKYVGTAWYS